MSIVGHGGVMPIKPLDLTREEGSVDQFIAVWENFVPRVICKEIIEEYDNLLEDISTNNVDEDIQAEIMSGETQFGNRKLGRSDISLMMNHYSRRQVQRISQYLQSCWIHYNDMYPNLMHETIFSSDVKIQKTEPGGGYHVWHCENSSYAFSPRTAVWSIYLNDIDEGGETEFLYQNKRIKPSTGTVVIWPAAFTHVHRGNPPLSQTKYILTGWYLTAPRLNNNI